MAFDLKTGLGVHPAAMRVRAERTKIIASNLANLDTPGYQARDIDFGESMADESVRGHSSASLAEGGALGYRVPFQKSQNGNTVELGVEQAAFAQNAIDFQVSLTFLNMNIRGLQTAITGNA
ncbi:flagellar basal body rod protein FlgB [Pandoraea apista]|uniref:flagellar basal body rod protein FlgB n=1 Tax=Pandoraea apista TaxID=93218 RepID=UPI000F6864BC|nr:flagellar basal body rod protein FlgB [Pandoraea apista]RRW88813.1 flagellar basal body rod protein FlgB [Pandoraea apista]RRW98072.1 flagellar basal body rod protein FlgB [Pandoraea apista]